MIESFQMKLNETIIVGLLIAFCFSTQAFALSDQEAFTLSDQDVREAARKELDKFSFPIPVNERVTFISASVLATGVLFVYQFDAEFDEIAPKHRETNVGMTKILCTDVAFQEFRKIVKNISLIVYDRNLDVVFLIKVDTENC